VGSGCALSIASMISAVPDVVPSTGAAGDEHDDVQYTDEGDVECGYDDDDADDEGDDDDM
jgi:hypothetical protein